jgi:AraC-like DNA-binding protein
MAEWLDQRDIDSIVRYGPATRSEDGLFAQFYTGPGFERAAVEFLPPEDGLLCSLNEWTSKGMVEDRIIIRNSIGVQFAQVGKVRQSLGGRKRYMHSGARVCVTTYPGEVRQHRRYAAGDQVRYLGAWISPDLLVDKFGLVPDVLNMGLRNFFTGNGGDPLCFSAPLPPRLWMALDDVFSTGHSGKLRHAYLSSKTNELICELVAMLSRRDAADHQSLTLKNRTAIDTAALIYMQELGNPPTLDDLAMRVGINRNKLSAGFQQIFGCSPHAYSKRVRMDWARRLLIEGVMAPQEIAHAVGYSTQSAFSRAFSDHFGFSPSDAALRPPDGEHAPFPKDH